MQCLNGGLQLIHAELCAVGKVNLGVYICQRLVIGGLRGRSVNVIDLCQ
jgi:hypothetical protein